VFIGVKNYTLILEVLIFPYAIMLCKFFCILILGCYGMRESYRKKKKGRECFSIIFKPLKISILVLMA
jgi:hypothetical protein